MDNGTNTRINRSEDVWKTKDFPLGESQKMRVNCAFFVNSQRVFSVGKCHFFAVIISQIRTLLSNIKGKGEFYRQKNTRFKQFYL